MDRRRQPQGSPQAPPPGAPPLPAVLPASLPALLRVGLLAASVLAALAVVGCAGSVTSGAAPAVYTPDPQAGLITVNIDVDDAGFDPPSVRIPAGRKVQLILRNRTRVERHYRVVGLDAAELLWLAQPEDMAREAGVTDEEHEAHHAKSFVDFRGTSPAGIKPAPTEVHAYAMGGGVDVVHFYPLTPGTYEVDDPLHPGLTGRVTVYEP